MTHVNFGITNYKKNLHLSGSKSLAVFIAIDLEKGHALVMSLILSGCDGTEDNAELFTMFLVLDLPGCHSI